MDVNQLIKDLFALMPALILMGGAIFFLIIQFFFHSNDHRIIRYLTGLILIASHYYLCKIYYVSPGPGTFFKGQIAVNEITYWLNSIYIITALFTIIASPRILNQHEIFFPEFYPLILLAVSGMYFMTSGADLIVIFVGLELLSISLYILIGMARKELFSLEATMKYFLLGAFSAGFMLMGIAFLFGGSGSTLLVKALPQNLLDPINSSPLSETSIYSNIGFGLLLVGVGFKIALVPFHSWTPDVYEGSLTTITGFMASGAKSAAMGLLLVLFSYSTAIDTNSKWNILLGIIAIVSMTFGNIVALKQENLKRVLAYSSISHAGYVVAGIVCGAKLEVLYYLIIYSLMNIAGFVIIAYLENGKHHVTYSSLKYLVSKKPWSAIGLLIIFFSLGGIPPLGGFWTKLFLFQKIAESENTLNRVLLIFGVVNSAIAIFYYLKVTVVAFMTEDKGEVTSSESIPFSFGLSFASAISILFVMFSWIIFQPSNLR